MTDYTDYTETDSRGLAGNGIRCTARTTGTNLEGAEKRRRVTHKAGGKPGQG
jgi:hypothetical protein